MALGKQPDADLEGAEDAIFAEINITPLTDLFLVMLIIFMVAAASALEEKEQQSKADKQKIEKVEEQKRSGLKINLPSGAAQEIDPTSKTLIVAISVKGDIEVNGQAIDPDDLTQVFRSAFALDKGTQVVLKADKGVHHGRVVGVMETAKEVGLTKLAIQTRGN